MINFKNQQLKKIWIIFMNRTIYLQKYRQQWEIHKREKTGPQQRNEN